VKTDQSAAHDNEGGILDLNDTNYAQDSQPILKGCTCLTCRPRKVSSRPVGYRHFQKEAADEIDTPAFSRAYIHHLIRAKEMLANTLLFIHNLHQLVMLFHKLSDARAASKLETFCDFVESQL
jgi:queuine tRNA-ribosyltransferase